MERGLKAAALFALIVVASADRALLAGKPSGGALHGVAIVSTATGATNPNYYITNGNGTWTYSYYSNNNVPNGNNMGQGGVSYASVNTAFATASGAGGTRSIAAAFTTQPTAASAPASGSADIRYYIGAGLAEVTFPSKNLGVAVGTLASSPTTTVGAGPNIIITIDGGLSWMAVTGLPQSVVAPGTLGAAAGAAAAVAAYPTISPGDLNGVSFASKTLGWAVGGNSNYVIPAAAGAGTADTLSAGIVYMTTNGGTVWKNIPLFYTLDQAKAAVAGGTASQMTAIYQSFVPGVLFGVSSDAAGKNVYAVGAMGMSGALTSGAMPVVYTVQSTPTIMYSGNGGAAWTSQTAPAPNTAAYGLLAVAVQKGTTAWAVGGSFAAYAAGPPVVGPATDNANGQIVYTMNGGFSWTQATFPSNSGRNAPVFTSVALNGNMVWVGGFTKVDQYYPVPAVASGLNGQTASNGQGYTILLSLDGKTFTGAASYASFPAGFVSSGGMTVTSAAGTVPVTTGFAGSAPTQRVVFGITWDNNVRGYIYGAGYIMSTIDGGKTWVYESPADVMTTSNLVVRSIANVPTSY